MDFSALRGKTKYIVIAIIILLVCLFIYQFFLVNMLTEGNPRIVILEINATISTADNTVHLSDQEYMNFPGLKEIIENQKSADQYWYNGKRHIGGKMITDEQRFVILKKYQLVGIRILEYKGKYYCLLYTSDAADE